MKRLITPLPSGGVPYENEDILQLQNGNFESLKQVLSGLGSAFVVSGCDILAVDTNLKTVSLSAGWAWLDGDIREFPAYTGSYPAYIKSALDTFDKKDLQDGTRKNVYVNHTATTVTSRPVGVDFIECAPAPTADFRGMVTGNLAAALAAEIADRQSQDAAESAARIAAINALTAQLTQLTNLVNTKVTRKVALIPWTPVDLTTFSYFTKVSQSGFPDPEFMRTEDGWVHFRGAVQPTNNGGGNFTTFGSGLQSFGETRQWIWDAGGTYKVQFVSVYGSLYLSIVGAPASARPIIFLDGLKFYAD